jgi:hypothetical protein
MEPFSPRQHPHSELSTGENLVVPVVVVSLDSAARGIYRSNMIGRDQDGNIYTAEALAVEDQMKENAARHAREKASSDGRETPLVLDD